MTTVHWHEIPFVRICIPFIIGILTQQACVRDTPLIIGVLTTSFLLLSLLLLQSPVRRLQLRSVIMLAGMFSLGCFVRHSAEPSTDDMEALIHKEDIHATCVEVAAQTHYGQKVHATVLSGATVKDMRAILYLRNYDRQLLPGDTLVFAGELQPQISNKNPYDFDVAGYYRRQGIYLKASVDSAEILDCREYKGPMLLSRKSAKVRANIKGIFSRYVMDAQSCAVLLAMTVGIVDGIDDSIYEAYAETGTIHVLSISGLHVGIISFLLFLLVGKIKHNGKMIKQILQLIVLLGGIWTFAYVAGLSPSVVRASLMTSIFLAGTTMRRPVRGLNVMAFTAFVCLSIDPLQINSLSFQFSYLALFSILIFFNPIYRLVPVKTWSMKFAWGTVVMSIAAQILLLPLLIHYFQQISLISIVSSLVAIPASYAILLGGALLLVLHFILRPVAIIAGHVIEWIIASTNDAIIGMSNLPLSHLSNVYLHPVEIILISCIILCLTLRMVVQHKSWTYATGVSVMAFGVVHSVLLMNTRDKELVAIYPVEETVAIDYIKGRQCYSSLDIDTLSKFTRQEARMFRNSSRIMHVQPAQITMNDSLKDIVLIELPSNRQDSVGSCRIALITQSKSYLPESFLNGLKADWIVLSPNLEYKVTRAAEKLLLAQGQPFHNLRKQGTFYLAKMKNNTTHEKLWQNITG